MEKEEWRDIVGYEGLYMISSKGKVFSWISSSIRSPLPNKKSGHLYVNLTKNKLIKNESVHRLVALAFIPNPENKQMVDHIDRNPENNCISNLRWCNRQENGRNSNISKANKTGFKGVSLDQKSNKFVSKIYIGKESITLGYYSTAEKASEAYKNAAKNYFGDFCGAM